MKTEEIGRLLKNRFRQFTSGGCKIISKGDDCDYCGWVEKVVLDKLFGDED